MSFLSCEEMLAAARSQNISLSEAILRSDLAESRLTEATLTLKLNLSGATKVAVLYTPKHGATGEPNDSYNDIYGTWDITEAIKGSL